MRARRGLLALTMTALALGTLAVPTSAAGTRWVDDDGKAGPAGCAGNAAAATKIQTAINAASANSLILVCPGDYKEVLTVGAAKDGLTIRAASQWQARVHRPASAVGVDSSLLHILPGAAGVTVQGLVFVVHAPTIVKSGDDGCFLDSAIWVEGQDATLRANRTRATGDTFGPCGYRTAIQIGDSIGSDTAGVDPAASALVTHNAVRDFTDAGITAVGAGVSATIERNSVRFWHLDTALSSAAAAGRSRTPAGWRVRGPAGPGSNGFGIAVGLGADGVVYGNEVSSGPNAVFIATDPLTPALTWGITTSQAGDVEIRGNTVRRAFVGISVLDSQGVLVQGNVSTDHYIGIWISASNDGIVRRNQVGPGYLGIVVEETGLTAGSVAGIDNRIVSNTSLGHDQYDCLDETDGAKTAGTGNTWKTNTGILSSPQPLCGLQR